MENESQQLPVPEPRALGRNDEPSGRGVNLPVGNVREELLRNILRWRTELDSQRASGVRTTLWFGIVQRCCRGLETLVASCGRYVITEAGDAGSARVRAISQKPLQRFTMGEHVRVIRELHSLAQKIDGVPLYPDDLGLALDELVRIRNDFQHPERRSMEAESMRDAIDSALALLGATEVLCRSELAARATAAERRLQGSTA